MSKMLYIVRGLPGSGKSTLANALSLEGLYPHFENDMFWYDDDGNYNWDASKVTLAAKWCKDNVEDMMRMGYDRIVVENRHGNKSIHDVPDKVVDRMERQLKNCIKLK
ncbi:hypothetical protein O8H85_002878 [Escherichia coli O157]|nr:hypothetical protein [Escherichia coli O157]EKH6169106.1 hypothetical protein [Escherichia coli O157]